MTPAKRRPSSPESNGPTGAAPAPDVPTAPPDVAVPDELVTPPVPAAETEDGTPLLGPDGEPIAQETPTAEAGQVDHPEDRATKLSPRRSHGVYPLPVWPD